MSIENIEEAKQIIEGMEEWDYWKEEADKLRAEVERLRGALVEIEKQAEKDKKMMEKYLRSKPGLISMASAEASYGAAEQYGEIAHFALHPPTNKERAEAKGEGEQGEGEEG